VECDERKQFVYTTIAIYKIMFDLDQWYLGDSRTDAHTAEYHKTQKT